MQAGSADPLVLDHGHAQAGRRAIQRGGIPTRATAQDYDIKLVRHTAPFSRRGWLAPTAPVSTTRQRAMRICTANAARIATPHTAASTISARVLMSLPIMLSEPVQAVPGTLLIAWRNARSG